MVANTPEFPDGHRVSDKGLIATVVAVPTATTLTYTGTIDLGSALTAKGVRLADCVLWIKLPSQTLAALPNGETLTVGVYAGAATAPTTVLMAQVIVQTGATGTDPAVAIEVNLKLPDDCPRYIRAGVLDSAGVLAVAGNMECELRF